MHLQTLRCTSLALYGGVLLLATNVFADCSGNQCKLSDPGTLNIPNLTVTAVATDIIHILSFLAGVLSVFFLVLGGIRYSSSNGNFQRVESAKHTITYAIIGLIVSILAWQIVDFVLSASLPHSS